MMNKKGFAILPLELIRLAVFLTFGIGLWLIYSGTKEYINLSGKPAIIYGLIIVLAVIFFTKFKPAHLLLPK